MKEYKQQIFEGERALFASSMLRVYDSVFQNGESPLKESRDIEIFGCLFKWKYPLWYCRRVTVRDSVIHGSARSGIWYTQGITVENSVIEAPKTFRRSSGIRIIDTAIPNAQETLWNCENVELRNVSAVGDYFGMGACGVRVENLTLDGNYVFDGGKNIEVSNSRLISKDAFWNAENVVVRDSVIIGEYLGWNSKNVTFINCTIESDQGMCYMDGVRLENCKLINTPLAFEYSSVDANVTTKIDSVKNPRSGIIRARGIDNVILEKERIDPEKTKIIIEG